MFEREVLFSICRAKHRHITSCCGEDINMFVCAFARAVGSDL